jgi:cytochrome c551/c552
MSRPSRQLQSLQARAALAVLVAGAALLLAGCGKTVISPVAGSTLVTVPKLVGNSGAGKVVYNANGCGACHAFTAAGSKGTIGPDLDNLQEYADKAGVPIEDFTLQAIVSPPAKYVPPGFPTNVMPTTFGQSLKPQQQADLVAFLVQNQPTKK